nr:putative ribosomal protein 3 [Cyanidiaceae sp.]
MNQYRIKVLWLKNNVAIAVDQLVYNSLSPITCYYFWPRADAWEQLKIELESNPGIFSKDKIAILNQVTRIIGYWQENKKEVLFNLRELRSNFPGLICSGID